MKNYKQGCLTQDELEFLGNGNLEKGIDKINKDGWTIRSVADCGTEKKYYFLEKLKLDE